MWLFLFIGVGAIAGWLAGQFMRGDGFGRIGDVVVGMTGALIGVYAFGATKPQFNLGLARSTLIAFGAATLLLFVVRLFTGRRSGRRLWS